MSGPEEEGENEDERSEWERSTGKQLLDKGYAGPGGGGPGVFGASARSRNTGIRAPSGASYLRCDWCFAMWDPGASADCAICKRYPPIKKKGKKGEPEGKKGEEVPRVTHTNHSMCFTCFNVYAKARKHVRLDDADLKHLARAADLRKKLYAESLLPQRNSDGEGDRPSA
jgi:hypothetical protein